MIKSGEIAHLLKGESFVGTQRWDDMFNSDSTNEVARHQRRYNDYNELFQNNSDLIERMIDGQDEVDRTMMSDNSTIISERIDRYEDQHYTGIVDIRNKTFKPYKLFTKEGNSGNTVSTDFNENPLSVLYFSKENAERIHILIRHNVWLQSGKKHIISKQSTLQLEIIMRSIFLQFSKNLRNNLKEQIDQLNSYVIDYSVNRILSGIAQYLGYKKDISSLPTIMDYPDYLSTAGEKSLENKAWF